MEIIAIPSTGSNGLKEIINSRFGRCPNFTLVSIEDGEIKQVKTIPNSAANAMGGAGTQSSQIIGNNGATVVIAGNLGPNAFAALSSFKFKIYRAPSMNLTIKELVMLYMDNKLESLSGANVGSHAGMGGGMGGGGGGGMGGGRGMGRGMGR